MALIALFSEFNVIAEYDNREAYATLEDLLGDEGKDYYK